MILKVVFLAVLAATAIVSASPRHRFSNDLPSRSDILNAMGLAENMKLKDLVHLLSTSEEVKSSLRRAAADLGQHQAITRMALRLSHNPKMLRLANDFIREMKDKTVRELADVTQTASPSLRRSVDSALRSLMEDEESKPMAKHLKRAWDSQDTETQIEHLRKALESIDVPNDNPALGIKNEQQQQQQEKQQYKYEQLANKIGSEEGSGYGPGNGPAYGPGNGPAYGPGNGPGNGPAYGPGNGPAYGPGNGPGNGPAYGPGNGPAYNPGNDPGNGLAYGPGNGPAYGPGNGPAYSPGHASGADSGSDNDSDDEDNDDEDNEENEENEGSESERSEMKRWKRQTVKERDAELTKLWGHAILESSVRRMMKADHKDEE